MPTVSHPTWIIFLARRWSMSKNYRNFKKRKDSKNKVNLWKDRMENSSRKYSTFEKPYQDIQNIPVPEPYVKQKRSSPLLNKIFRLISIFLTIFMVTITMQFSPLAIKPNFLYFALGIILYLLFIFLLISKLNFSKYVLLVLSLATLLLTTLGLSSQVTIGDKVFLRYSETAYIYNESKFLLSSMYDVQNNTTFLQKEISFISANQGSLDEVIADDKGLISKLGTKKYKFIELSNARDLLINALVNQITAAKYLENEIEAHDDKNISNINEYLSISNRENKNAASELGNFTMIYDISLEELNNE